MVFNKTIGNMQTGATLFSTERDFVSIKYLFCTQDLVKNLRTNDI